MRRIMSILKKVAVTSLSFLYDMVRYFKYSRLFDSRLDKRYFFIKAEHKIEKSLSFRNRKKSAGIKVANSISQELQKTDKMEWYHESAISALKQFYNDIDGSDVKYAKNYILKKEFRNIPLEYGGVFPYNEVLGSGVLKEPEKFFMSRYSIRDFQDESVSIDDILRGISLASKSPSVCNRQPWHVYHISESEKLKKILNIQGGNVGFGHSIKNLLVVCCDISAFNSAGERNQGWIDGGMFSMSLVWALHSLGIATCCLNWSKDVFDDVRIRKFINMPGNHSIIMAIAAGYPRPESKVCVSKRGPLEEIFTNVS